MSEIGIIGGGLIGSAAAVWLQAEGYTVTLFEADPAARHASSGNAGILVTPETDPLVSLDTLKAVPRWLTDPLGPLTLRWRDIPALAPWLWRFFLSAMPASAARASAGLIQLTQSARADHEQQARLAGMETYFRPTGCITIFHKSHALEEEFHRLAPVHAELGHQIDPLSAEEVRKRTPAMTGAFAGGVFFPGWNTVSDPRIVLDGLRAHVEKTGQIVPEKVNMVTPGTDRISVATETGQTYDFEKIVIAAGVWSRSLVRQLGLKVLLETERGYNTTWAQSPVDMPLPLGFPEHGFYASPLDGQLRVGGAVELASVDAPPNMARAGAMRSVLRRYMPDLPDEGGVEWMGRRPSTPDSLPVISAHPTDPRIVMGFGHGHLGLTLSATTARMITQLIAGANGPEFEPFSITRFQ